MIEYIVFIIILIFLSYIFFRNKNAVFLLVLLNILIFVLEILYPYSLFILGFHTNSILSVGILTGIFTHYDYMHILLNMVVLLLIGYPFETKIGARRFLIIYLITGIFSEIIYGVINFNSDIILLGASGSIFGIMGAFLRLYPDDEIAMFLGFIFMPKVKVKYAVLFMVIVEFLAEFLSINDNIAHLVHLTAFVIGLLIAPIWPVVKYETPDLEHLVKDEKSAEMLKKIKSERIPEIRKILLEDFLKYVCDDFKKEKDYYICNGKKFKL